jgi:hypothetical protein
MGKPTIRAEIRRELKRSIANAEWVAHHLLKVRSYCIQGKRPEIGAQVDKLGEMVLAVQSMIEKFRDSI